MTTSTSKTSKTTLALTAYAVGAETTEQALHVQEHVKHLAHVASIKNQEVNAYVQNNLHLSFNWNAFFNENEASRAFSHLRQLVNALLISLKEG